MKKHDFSSDVKTWKALKALILSKGQIIPKIHSLDRLISYLKELKTETAEIEDGARELDEFYLTTRYPGQYGGPEGMYSKEEATKAITAAEEILRFVKQEVKI